MSFKTHIYFKTHITSIYLGDRIWNILAVREVNDLIINNLKLPKLIEIWNSLKSLILTLLLENKYWGPERD